MHQNIIKLNCILTFLFTGILLYGCIHKQKKPEVTVFAAMSLTDVLLKIDEQFTKVDDVKVVYNFAASTTLQRQIEKGAYADIFISASSFQVDALDKQNFLEINSRVDLLSNRLVIVSHNKSDMFFDNIERLTDITVGKIAIGQPDYVPAGTYAKEVLIQNGLWEKLTPKLVFGTDVRSTLAYVSSGNVDLAFVYKTDVTFSKNVKIIHELPSRTHTPIVYPAVILKKSIQKDIAHQYMKYLKSPTSTDIFEKHGFTILNNSTER